MNMFDSMFSPNSVLNEQLARQIFDILPEQGPLMMIMDGNGHCWPSCSERFEALNISKSYLKDFTGKIDDGMDPVITKTEELTVVASQLATPKTNCGYVFMFLPPNFQTDGSNFDIMEILIGQISLIAKLIEQNNQLYELSAKHYNTYLNSLAASN